MNKIVQTLAIRLVEGCAEREIRSLWELPTVRRFSEYFDNGNYKMAGIIMEAREMEVRKIEARRDKWVRRIERL